MAAHSTTRLPKQWREHVRSGVEKTIQTDIPARIRHQQPAPSNASNGLAGCCASIIGSPRSRVEGHFPLRFPDRR